MRIIELRNIIKSIIIEDLLDKTITNPETGRDVKVSSALSYDKDSDVYKKAKSIVSDKKEDTNIPKEVMIISSGKFKKLNRNSQIKVITKFEKQAEQVESALNLKNNRNMTDNDMDALDMYASIEYKNINSYLRGQTNKVGKKTLSAISTINDIFKKNNLESETSVYRGLSGSDILNSLENGKSFVSKAYTSTSINPYTANSFNREDGFMMKINLKKGQPIAYIGGGEKEMLLPANTRFRVINKDDKNRIVEVEPILD